jgi:multimeric flavodoxin WrbA
MISADAIVYATPLYCWDFTSQMRALIDRHVCLVSGFETPSHSSALEGKTTALLVTCEGPVKDNADLIQIMFDRLNGYAKSFVAGKFILPGCVSPDKIGDKADKAAAKMATAVERTVRKNLKA